MSWPLDTTHLRQWHFTPSKLQNIKLRTYEEAKQTVLELDATVDVPSFEEQQAIISYYTCMLIRFSIDKKLRPVIQETACTFFNRFYIKKSVLLYDPRIMIFTCITLAIKCEEYAHSYTVDDLFGSLPEVNVASVFQLELTLCETLQFHLLVLHTREPIRALRDACLEKLMLELKLEGNQLKEYGKILLNIGEDAEADCIQMQETAELQLLYTPAQLAIAAFYTHAIYHLNAVFNVQSFLSSFATRDQPKLWPSVKQTIDTILKKQQHHNELSVHSKSFEEGVKCSMQKCMDAYDIIKVDTSHNRNKRRQDVLNVDSNAVEDSKVVKKINFNS